MPWKYALHTVSYAGVWHGQASLPVEEILGKAKTLGFDGVMLMAKRPHLSPLDYGKVQYNNIKKSLDFTAGIDQPMSPMTEIQAIYVRELARMAQDLGTSTLRVFTGIERGGASFDRLWQACVQGLKLSAQQASQFGVNLAVQNHHDVAVHHDSLRWMLEEINEPNCRAAFDAWAPALQGLEGPSLEEAVSSIAPSIAHTTAADYVKLPRYIYHPDIINYSSHTADARAVPMGEGIVDYHSFFTALEKSGYDGWIAYEMCAPLKGGGSIENLDRCAGIFLEYMQQEKWRDEIRTIPPAYGDYV